MSLNEQIEAVRSEFRAALESFPTNPQAVEELRVKFLGRKGAVANLFQSLAQLDPSEKPVYGKKLNALKQDLTQEFEEKIHARGGRRETEKTTGPDYTLPGWSFPCGSLHPLEQTLNEIKSIFTNIGFSVAYGPDVDDDYHNFQALNIPKHHPARDMQDTFFVDENTVLRTHTSNVQIHLMETQEPPLRFIVPGRVYRNEALSYKSYCLFHQVEGLFVDKTVSFTELKGTLEHFVLKFFGAEAKTRFRPSFFPFTEPSAEMDIWNEERGQWMEILGCGMVDPAVFESVGYDPQIWHGYAFGIGVERMALLKYKIEDIRQFYQGDVRFLRQF